MSSHCGQKREHSLYNLARVGSCRKCQCLEVGAVSASAMDRVHGGEGELSRAAPLATSVEIARNLNG